MKKNKTCSHKVTYYDPKTGFYKCQFCAVVLTKIIEFKPYSGKILKTKEQVSTVKTDEELDKLIKAKLFEKQPCCEYCGSEENLDPAHIYKRRKHSLRWDLLNLITLCRTHHSYFELHSTEWRDWWTNRYPDRVEYLDKKYGVTEKVNNQVVFNYIKEL